MKMRIVFTVTLTIALLMPAFHAAAQTTVTEGFESGVPASAPSTETNATLSSGVWAFYKAGQTTTKHGETYAVSMSSNSTAPGYVNTPSFSTVGTVSFWARGGGANTMTIQKSVNGSAYTTIASQSITSSYAQYTISVNDTSKDIRIKFLNTPGSGTTEYFDDVSITTLSRSAISVSAASLPGFGQIIGGSVSSSANYTVSGAYLEAPLLIVAPRGYRLSTDNLTFGSSLSLTPGADSSIAATTIYVQFAPDSAEGTMSGSISHSSGAAIARAVAVSGTAIGIEPTVQSAIAIGTVTGNSIVLNLSGGNGAGRLVVARAGSAVSWSPTDAAAISGINTDFSAATDQQDGNKIVSLGSAASVTVSGLAVATTYYFAVFEFNGGPVSSLNYLTVSPGTANQTTLAVAGLAATPSTLAFGTIVVNSISSEKTYALSGSYLDPADGSITVAAPAGFEISRSTGTGFTSSVDVAYSAGTLAPTTMYVRFHPTAKTAFSGNVTHSGGSAPIMNVAVSGTGADSSILTIKAYYVATNGADANPGTIGSPFATLTKAMSVAVAGDLIYMRGGTYTLTATFKTNKSGTSGHYINLWAYPGEQPVLDCSGVGSGNRGIELPNDYWYIKGLEIKLAGDNGMYISGGYNIIEQCAIHGNQDSGLQVSGGGHNNKVLNSDSYDNYDPGSHGGNADGFSPKLDVGNMNEFHGCRAWHNSDDGWDCFGNVNTVIIDSCWAWSNGFDQGNGNGIKTSGNKVATTAVVTNCISFNNIAKGFDQNHNMGNVTIYNCTSYHNKTGNFYFYEIPTSGTQIFKNCISYVTITRADSIQPNAVQASNSWLLPGFKVSDADFESLDTTQALLPRKADGSLPDITLFHLKATSPMVDAGVDVGIPYSGSAPDLGAFERALVIDVQTIAQAQPKSFELLQNYPNPFNPSTVISYRVPAFSSVTLIVFDLLGREVATLVNDAKGAGSYQVKWDAGKMTSGIYFYQLKAGSFTQTKKMLLMK